MTVVVIDGTPDVNVDLEIEIEVEVVVVVVGGLSVGTALVSRPERRAHTASARSTPMMPSEPIVAIARNPVAPVAEGRRCRPTRCAALMDITIRRGPTQESLGCLTMGIRTSSVSGHARNRRRSPVLAVLVLVAALGSGCTPTPTAPPVTGSPSASSASSSGVLPASLVLVKDNVMITKGVKLTPTCDGAPTATQAIADKAEVKVPAATTAIMPTGERLTICLPEPFQGAKPAPAGTTVVKVRVFYDVVTRYPIDPAQLVEIVFANGKAVPAIVAEPGYLPAVSETAITGESVTFEAILALPPGAKLTPFIGAGYMTTFDLPLPAAGAAPQAKPSLPSPTGALPKPTMLPQLEPGMTLNDRFTGEVAGDVRHSCGGAATAVVTTISKEEALTSERTKTTVVVKPGDSVQSPYVRVTLCPGAAYTPTPGAALPGDYDYRVFTAYRTSLSTTMPDWPIDFFANVTDASGAVIAGSPAGRLLDPSQVPYLDRGVYNSLSTLVWTFAVAVPKTGGPYYLRTSGDLRVLYPIS